MFGNRLYVGGIIHRGQIYCGNHKAIIAQELFAAVQAKLKGNAHARKLQFRGSTSLLSGLLFDSAGNCMTPAHTLKRGVRYRYYLSQSVLKHLEKAKQGEVVRVSAPAIEETMAAFLHNHVKITGPISNVLWAHVERITVWNDRLEIRSSKEGAIKSGGQDYAVPVILPWQPKIGWREKGAHSPGGPGFGDARDREVLLRAIATSRQWLKDLVEGASITDIGKAAGLGERQVRILLNLAFVPPA